ncbi:MAG: hypothetical protein JWM86_1921, partial [Thermoleophilia bacterium]|nr:hypothetical protein [Thermoleophilia bacterium]
MAQVQSDGGGSTKVQPTATATSDRRGKGPLALPSGARTPSGPTLFARPVKGKPAKPSITDVLRRNAKSTPTKPSASRASSAKTSAAKPTSTRPSKSSPVAPSKSRSAAPTRSSKAGAISPTATTDDAIAVATAAAGRRGTTTSNDGLADGGVTEGTNVGARDIAIAKLKEQQATLTKQSNAVADDIEELEDEVEGDETKSGIIGAVATVAMPGVSAVAGLFGKKNPAQALAEKVMGIEEDKKDLEAKKGELDEARDQIAADIKALEGERVLNFLADVAHVTGMPAPVVQVLEGSESLTITAQKKTAIGSDAAYDKDTNTIIADDGVLDTVGDVITTLRSEGIVNSDGQIIDAAGFDASETGDKAIGTAALLGVHEPTHGSQDHDGDKITKVNAEVDAIVAAATKQARNMPPEDRKAVLGEATKRAEMHRIDALEYDSYVNQETVELQAGKQKKLFTTINPDGSLLPRADAVRNIYELQQGGAMVAGVSKGSSVADVTGEDRHDHEHEHDHEAETSAPAPVGNWLHDLLTGGTGTPGRFTGGDTTPGRFTGGDETPGRFTGGGITPGRFTGGDETPGRFTGGDLTPGRFTGGDLTPGRFTGGDLTPGRFTGGDLTPGRFTGGDLTPGRFTGGDLTPGRFTGGDETPGR